MAVNHFGHAILTSHLLPLIKKTAEAGNTVRICNQASNAHQAAPSDTKFASLEEINRDSGPNGNYGLSKLAGILYAKYLNKHLTAAYPRILVNATHPGFVDTKQTQTDIHDAFPLGAPFLQSSLRGYLNFGFCTGGFGMSVLMKPFKKSQFEGALSAIFACTKVEASGLYICVPATVEKGSDMANDLDLAEQLMKLTDEVIAQKTASQSVDKGCPFTNY